MVGQARASLDEANEELSAAQKLAISEGTAESYERVEVALSIAKKAAEDLKIAEDGINLDNDIAISLDRSVSSSVEETVNQAANEAMQTAVEEVVEGRR